MRAIGVLAVGAVALIAGGAAVMALRNDDEDSSDVLDLPQPTVTECSTAEDIWATTEEILADPAMQDPALMNGAAHTFDTWGEYCDDNARNMGKMAAVLLRARADQLENTPPSTAPPPITPGINLPPSPIQLPGGTYYAGFGWCPPGAVLDMQTHMCDFTNPTIIQTSGKSCCQSCADGHECEGGCG